MKIVFNVPTLYTLHSISLLCDITCSDKIYWFIINREN